MRSVVSLMMVVGRGTVETGTDAAVVAVAAVVTEGSVDETPAAAAGGLASACVVVR